MLLSDSRGLDLYIALKTAYPDRNVYVSNAIACAPVFKATQSPFFRNCRQFNKKRLEVALAAPVGDTVVLAMNLTKIRAPMAIATAKQLVESGKRVYVVGESKFLEGKIPQVIAIDQEMFFRGSDYTERFLVAKPFGMDDTTGADIEAVGATYISNRDFFHDGENYKLYTHDRKDLLSYDALHLSVAGAKEYGAYLAARYPRLGISRDRSREETAQ